MGQCSSQRGRVYNRACQCREDDIPPDSPVVQVATTEEKLPSHVPPPRDPAPASLCAGDIHATVMPNPYEIDFLELFEDEVKVLSGLANLEMDLLRGDSVAVDKDDLICLLMQESHRLAMEQRKAKCNGCQTSNDRGSVTSIDGLKIVTRLLLRLRNSDGALLDEEHDEGKVESSIDSGVDEDLRASMGSPEEHSGSSMSQKEICGGLEKILKFNEDEGKEAILKEFLHDVENFDGHESENDAESCFTRFPEGTTAMRGLRRNKMSLHLFGTSRLHEELKLPLTTRKIHFYGHPSQQEPRHRPNRLSYYPVNYKFWTPMDETLLKCFSDQMDRRILAVCRRSHCQVQLLTSVRKNANGMSVQQISIQAPSLGALERCCSILDDVFPQFNASITLRGRGSNATAVTDSKTEQIGETVAEDAVSTSGTKTVQVATGRSEDNHSRNRSMGVSRPFASSTVDHSRHRLIRTHNEGVLLSYATSQMKKK